jgi:hypothetical protein
LFFEGKFLQPPNYSGRAPALNLLLRRTGARL